MLPPSSQPITTPNAATDKQTTLSSPAKSVAHGQVMFVLEKENVLTSEITELTGGIPKKSKKNTEESWVGIFIWKLGCFVAKKIILIKKLCLKLKN